MDCPIEPDCFTFRTAKLGSTVLSLSTASGVVKNIQVQVVPR